VRRQCESSVDGAWPPLLRGMMRAASLVLMMLGMSLACDVVRSDQELVSDLAATTKRTGLVVATLWGNELTVIPIGGKPERRFLNTTTYFFGGAIHPSGKWLVGPTDAGLVAMDMAGTRLWVIDSVRTATNVRWSVDGRWLAYEGKDLRSGFEGIQVIDTVNGREPVTVAKGQQPSWGPDARLAFETPSGIQVFDAGSRSSEPLFAAGSSPAWSPNGRLLAYLDEKGNFQLYDFERKATTKLFSGEGVAGPVLWSPDSQLLLLVKRGARSLFNLGLECPEPRQVVIHRIADTKEAAVHQVCKSAPLSLQWMQVAPG
jgi:hypothetical protein